LPILGAVLVGGKSQRFGSDKADAQFAGVSLLTHQLNLLRSVPVDRLAYVGGDLRITVDPSVGYASDAIAGVDTSERSSLLGILAALSFARNNECDSAIIVGCDVPLVTRETLQQLVAALSESASSFDIAVASSGAERDHWSIMAANVSVLAQLRAAYEHGQRAVYRAVATLQVTRVVLDEDEAVNINDQTALADIATDLRGAR
jgi:molybdopterin-guanine dinucleotide biosynthesis protein A